MSDRLYVARTILAQLGGNRFVTMTGASEFKGDEQSLRFRLPRDPGYVKNGIDLVTIVLEPTDLYTMRTYKTQSNGDEPTLIDEEEMLYCDMLESLFTDLTGLNTRL